MKERRFNPHHRNTKDHKRLLHTILCQQIGQARRKRLKSRDITLPTKVHIVKAKVFPVVMYECESWTIKKAEHQKIDAFELWYWRRKTLESLLDCKESTPINSKGNQCLILIGRTDAEAEAPILWPLDAKSWLTGKTWCWERLKAKGQGGNRGWDS